jgi:hypothetical protein
MTYVLWDSEAARLERTLETVKADGPEGRLKMRKPTMTIISNSRPTKAQKSSHQIRFVQYRNNRRYAVVTNATDWKVNTTAILTISVFAEQGGNKEGEKTYRSKLLGTADEGSWRGNRLSETHLWLNMPRIGK